MPLIKVQTSISHPGFPQVSVLLKALSAALAKHTRKPEAYVMTMLECDRSMTFGGTSAPACYVEVKSVGSMTPDQTSAMSQDFCQQIHQELGVALDRIYIEFADAKGFMWGWNGQTFG